MIGRRVVTWTVAVFTAVLVCAPGIGQARVQSHHTHHGRRLKDHCVKAGPITICYVTA
jgi:hypothetical protein